VRLRHSQPPGFRAPNQSCGKLFLNFHRSKATLQGAMKGERFMAGRVEIASAVNPPLGAPTRRFYKLRADEGRLNSVSQGPTTCPYRLRLNTWHRCELRTLCRARLRRSASFGQVMCRREDQQNGIPTDTRSIRSPQNPGARSRPSCAALSYYRPK